MKLGLPLEYKTFPEYFDAHNIGDDTEAKNTVLEKLLKKYNVKTVLDLTCGTGSQVFFLHQRGYDVVGSDFSPDLLKIARRKAGKAKIKWVDGDMRSVRVGQFDAAITMFNSVGHLTQAGFEKAMRNIRKNLKDGGLYVFDIFNLDAMTDKVVSKFSMHSHKIVGDTQIHHAQCSTIDRKNALLTSYDCNTFQKNAERPTTVQNKFSLQIYSAKKLRELLSRNGFKVLKQTGIDGAKFSPKRSISILTVAQKVTTF
jgi:SAM-dependent methyltransferase